MHKILKEIESQIDSFKEKGKLFEIVISDNCSTDTTDDVVQEFKNNNDLNIRYNKRRKNEGAQVNIIDLVKISRGRFIWLLGDDDILAKNSLQRLLKIVKRQNVIKYFTTDINAIDVDNKLNFKIFFPKISSDMLIRGREFIKKYLYACGFLSVNIFERNFLLGIMNKYTLFDVTNPWHHLIVSALVINKCDKVYIISKPLVTKGSPSNLIYGPNEYIDCYLKNGIKVIKKLNEFGVKDAFKGLHSNYFISFKLFKILYLYYVFTLDYLKINYCFRVFEVIKLTNIKIIKLLLLIWALPFLIPAKILRRFVYLYYIIFKSRDKYIKTKETLVNEIVKLQKLKSGNYGARTYCD